MRSNIFNELRWRYARIAWLAIKETVSSVMWFVATIAMFVLFIVGFISPVAYYLSNSIK